MNGNTGVAAEGGARAPNFEKAGAEPLQMSQYTVYTEHLTVTLIWRFGDVD